LKSGEARNGVPSAPGRTEQCLYRQLGATRSGVDVLVQYSLRAALRILVRV
jgi:hypothetical protein